MAVNASNAVNAVTISTELFKKKYKTRTEKYLFSKKKKKFKRAPIPRDNSLS